MKLYEIDQAIASLVDPETGEIMDFKVFEELHMSRDKKLENMALWVKDLLAEATALKAEIANLAERKKATENKAESLKKYLAFLLNGKKFKTTRCDVSFRKSTAVELDAGFLNWAKIYADDLLKYKEPDINKTAIKKAITSGTELEHARVVDKQNIQIK